VFPLVAGDRFSDVNVVESGVKILLDGPGDLTSHRAEVTIRDESGIEYETYSFWASSFTVCNLKPGRNYVYVNGHCLNESWSPQWYQGALRPENAAPVDLAAGELRTLTMNLEPGGGVEGSVFKSDGTRPNRAYCTLYDLDGDPLCGESDMWFRSEEGIFNFMGLADGGYYLATIYLDEPWYYPGTWEFTEAVPIVIENHVSVTGLELYRPTLPEAGTP
jgi:hypothetical protein